ncbi:non-specific lipid transfer protein GPI-anchored 5-like [Phragmites australis]|uniref:non-specific lipid transfer protein GPI-anchored 5-like n=1 Tax=Phragmites australis TaxID=29695 RepID=UPI002D79D856|nr:non-specific lipid transfer protein GPI-anchored 5-like [Phragmites australis]
MAVAASGRARPAPFCLLAAATASLLVAAAAEAGARSGASECTSALVSLSPCVNDISGDDTMVMSRCCSQLMSVARSKPQCLCAALGLPAACNVEAQRASECNG